MLLLALSCNKENNIPIIKQENGIVWRSGGLANCAEQIHLDNGDTLIVKTKEIKSYKSEERVSLKYKEIGINTFCAPGIDCDIIEIKKIE